MNTDEVVQRLYGRFNITKKETKRILDRLQQIWVKELEQNHRFTIPGLGTFDTHVRDAHISYNPYYKRDMRIPPKKVMDFKASADLKSKIESISPENE